MIHHCKLVTILALTAAVLLLRASLALAGNLPVSAVEGTAVQPAEQPAETGAEEVATEEEAPPETPVETHNFAQAFSGYRFVGTDASGGRAAEYDYLHSSAVGGLTLNSLGKDLKFAIEGGYLNDKDYHGDLLTDYKGEYRLHLRTESLFHNLDRERLFAPSPFSFGGTTYTAVTDPPVDYGIKVEQDLAQFRYKLHDFPIHINVGYWRMVKDGASQLRFADAAFDSPDANTVKSQSRRIDRQTHEGTAGFDAHLGPVDLIYNFQIRQFTDHAGTPLDSFSSRSIGSPVATLVGSGGLQAHNEDTDSRFYSHTVKLHTSMTGGIVGAASYSYGRRENLSSLTGVVGASQTTNTLQNAAGDFSFTPCKWFSASLNYRRQEVSRDTPATLVSAYAVPVPSNVAVRPAVDTQKDLALATLSLRLLNDLLTVKGEYKGEFLHRDNTQAWLFAGDSNLPEHSALHRGTLTLISRPVKGLRLKAFYGYSVTDHPAYGNAFGEKHEGQLLATYALAKRTGLTASYRVIRESNDEISRPGFNTNNTTTPPTLVTSGQLYQFAREKRTSNTSVSLWLAPVDRLTVSGSYGLLWNKVEQGVLFSSAVPGSDAATSYSNQAQLYALNGVYQLSEQLALSLALQQVRSLSRFDPTFKTVTLIPGWDTAGVKEISQARTVESSISARGDYRLSDNSSCSVEYSYRDYDNENVAFFNGTVQTVMAYLAVKW